MGVKENYTAVLDSIFDNIFELDFTNRTLINLKSKNSVACCPSSSIRMYMDDAVDAWINSDVYEEDRTMVRELFASAEKKDTDNGKMRIQFRMGCCCSVSWYFGEIVKFTDDFGWFCFNLIDDRKGVVLLNNESVSREAYLQWASGRAGVCSRAGIIVVDLDFHYERSWTAEGFEKYALSSLTPSQMLSEEYAADMVYTDDRNSFFEFLDRIFSGEYEYTDTIARLLMSDGQFRWTSIGACVFFSEKSEINRIIMTFFDIEAVKEKDFARQKAYLLISRLMDNNGFPVYSFVMENGVRRMIYLNKQCAGFFGIKPSEAYNDMMMSEDIGNRISHDILTDDEYASLIADGSGRYTVNGRPYIFRCRHTGFEYIVSFFASGESDEDGVPETGSCEVKITSFGYFDVFVGNVPVLFKNAKAKELLALLVDRKGGFVSSAEAIGYLWEDEPVNERTMARFRKTAMILRDTLREYSIEHIIENRNGKRRIIPETVSCDLFDYLSGDEKYSGLFRGFYMQNYSWGEYTLSGLG